MEKLTYPNAGKKTEVVNNMNKKLSQNRLFKNSFALVLNT